MASCGCASIGASRACSRSCAAISPSATWAADELVVPGPAADRPRALDIVRASGGQILGLTAEEGRLDLLYRELVRGQP